MNLIIICGPPASGKMTVGQELLKLTGYKLFYNHLSLELVNQFFDFGTTPFENLDKKIRFDIFKEIEKSDIGGLIFTITWDFNDKADEEYVDEILSVFNSKLNKVCFIELICDLEERLKRNKHENRLRHKASKRDLAFSEKLLLKEDELYRMNSLHEELPDKSILKIENTHLTALEVAEKIVEHFKLEKIK